MKKDKRGLTVRQIQLAELEILKWFIKICEENQLRYFLYGGTALGAVRHEGFIPWDDDIDIIMPRPDYDRLIELSSKISSGETRYKMEFPEAITNPHVLIGKIYDTTIRVEADNAHDSGYLWIDIMQLDGLPERYEGYLSRVSFLRKIYLAKMKQYKKAFAKNMTKTQIILKKVKRIPLLLINYDKLTKFILKYCKKYPFEGATYVCNNAWYTTPSKIFKKEWFRDAVKVNFEDIEADICIDYDEFLSKRYGKNYMKIPPKSEQITHSFEAWRIDDK